uniref:(northern house mosquito) hypothetical protein n=1 Tax=Culex pipiens TaxID=7175 RepID=A0A8D8GCC1_CULPI
MARDHDESFARFNFPDQIVNFLLDAQVDPDNPDKIVEILVQHGLAKIAERADNLVTLDFQLLNADEPVTAPTEYADSSPFGGDKSSVSSDFLTVEFEPDSETTESHQSATFNNNYEETVTEQPLTFTSAEKVLSESFVRSPPRPGGAQISAAIETQQPIQSTSGKNADHSQHAPGGAHQRPQSTSGWEKIPKEEDRTEQVLSGYFVRSLPRPSIILYAFNTQ